MLLYVTFAQSRLKQLTLPENNRKPYRHRTLTQQSHPKRPVAQPLSAQAEIWKHRSGPRRIRRARPRGDCSHGSNDLGEDEGESDMKPCERLQKDDAKADALDTVENTQPTPQCATQDGAESRGAPRDKVRDTRDTPQHLGPTGSAEADGEDGDDPRVLFAQVAEDKEGERPDTDEEDEKE